MDAPKDFSHNAINYRNVLSVFDSRQSLLARDSVNLSLCRFDNLGMLGHHLHESRHRRNALHTRQMS